MLLLLFALLVPSSDSLTVTFIGNEGVMLSDGATTLMVDLPYQSGYSGYMTYEPSALAPVGNIVSVITHRHSDHFDPALFAERDWSVIGPHEVTASISAERIVPFKDRMTVGNFVVDPFATPHADVEHYSYRITWQGRAFYFVGDTDDPTHLLSMRNLDIAFVSPWLHCAAQRAGGTVDAQREIMVHQVLGQTDYICDGQERLAQGESFTLLPASRE
ncbi:MAG: hypothetical protein RhofKO_18810 [Rhodothermales bacterium]